ncbi:MAG TPA: TlpA disulfide reductase family protein [Bryobacteraceae bacterium]|nr:TlpA disulfide reductase family protein [Bryobacteraceae bacterium]
MLRRTFFLSSYLLLPLLAVDVPRKAPEFVIHLPDGGQKLLSQYRGKVVALEFLFTTCPHCQSSAQTLTRLQNEYGSKGFQAVGVAFNGMSKMLVPDFVGQFRVGFPVGFSEREPVNQFLQNPPENALHVPQLVFIDRKGMIRAQSLPRNDNSTGVEANMRKLIEQLLAEPAGAAPAKSKRRPS